MGKLKTIKLERKQYIYASVTFATVVIRFICLRFSLRFFRHRRWLSAKTYVYHLAISFGDKRGHNLMPRLHLPRSSYDLFVYDFLCDFFGIVGGYKLRRMCLNCLRSPYDFFRRQTRTKPYRDLADIVRQPQGYRTIIVLSSRPPYINRLMPVR